MNVWTYPISFGRGSYLLSPNRRRHHRCVQWPRRGGADGGWPSAPSAEFTAGGTNTSGRGVLWLDVLVEAEDVFRVELPFQGGQSRVFLDAVGGAHALGRIADAEEV